MQQPVFSFPFLKLPSLCQDKILKRMELIDLIPCMDEFRVMKKAVFHARINVEGYEVQIENGEGTVRIFGKNWYMWMCDDSENMVEKVIKRYQLLMKCFRGELKVLVIQSQYVPTLCQLGFNRTCSRLTLEATPGKTDFQKRTIASFIESSKITGALECHETVAYRRIHAVRGLESLYLHSSRSMTVSQLIALDAKHIRLEKNSFISKDINTFVKKWLNSECSPQLLSVCIEMCKNWNTDVVFDGLQTTDWNSRLRGSFVMMLPMRLNAEKNEICLNNQDHLLDMKDFTIAKNVVRSDGATASIRFRNRFFFFDVHTQDFDRNIYIRRKKEVILVHQEQIRQYDKKIAEMSAELNRLKLIRRNPPRQNMLSQMKYRIVELKREIRLFGCKKEVSELRIELARKKIGSAML